MKPAMSRQDAVASVAKDIRENAAKSGVQMTQTEAESRVRSARERGDRIRDNGNR